MDKYSQALLKLSTNVADNLCQDEQIIQDVYDDSSESLLRQSSNAAEASERILDDLDSLDIINKYAGSPREQLADILKRYNESVSRVEDWGSIKKKLERKQESERMQHATQLARMLQSIKEVIKHMEKIYLDPNYALIKDKINKLKMKLNSCVGQLAKDLSWLKK